MITIKRIYEEASVQDGFRILVDRIWPRGVSKDKAKLDLWMKEVAPGDELRKWFDHDPKKWEAFKSKYKTELKGKAAELNQIKVLEKQHKKISLLYGAKSVTFNQAVVLKEILNG